MPETRDTLSKNSKDVPWYDAELGDFSAESRELFEKYSGIAPDRVNGHIQDIEPESKNTLLDLGCCFAQDIRKLVYDGVPSENLYACDLRPEYLDLSYDLFLDKNKMRAKFFSADVFEEPGSLDQLYGKIDVIHAASFLHLFGWDDQLRICKRLIKILKPRKGSLVFGRQTGNIQGREVPPRTHALKDGAMIWRHDPQSFQRLWDIAGRETDTRWKTWVELLERPGHWAEEGIRRLNFEVERLE
ncbi:hypothetical protein ACLMJK_002992 [Lecanora helva]